VKLMRVAPPGGERPAALDGDGLRDLSTVVGGRSPFVRGRLDPVDEAPATGALPRLDPVGLAVSAPVAGVALPRSEPAPYWRPGDVVLRQIDGLRPQRQCLAASP
jgi:hypothetical protein